MYYMKAICTCLHVGKNDIPMHLRKPQKWHKLTNKDKDQLLLWASLLHPSRLTEYGVFAAYEELIPEGLTHVFFVPNDGRVSWRVSPVFTAEDATFQVTAVMVHTAKWLKKVYEKPLDRMMAVTVENKDKNGKAGEEAAACTCLCCLTTVFCCCCRLCSSAVGP